MRLDKINIFFLLLIIISSFLFAFSYNIDARILAEGTIQSGTINYPDGFNLHRAISLNSWSLPIQLVAILTKLNFSTFFISKIVNFFSTTMYLLGIYLICKSITNSRVLSFLISFLIILLKKNFGGDLDYPTLIFSEHSNGLIAQAMFTMIFGFFINNNYKLGIFFSIISISIHFTVGLWIFSIVFLCFFINNKYYKDFIFKKKNLYIFLLSFLTLFLSFFIHYLQKVPFEIIKNLDDYKTYMEVWDSHRTGYGAYQRFFSISYIIKTLILIISMFLFFLLKLNNHKIRFGITALLMHCLLSLTIYILYKYFYVLFPEIIIRTIPTRFFTLHSVIGWPIIFSFLYIFCKKISKSYINSKYIFNFFLLIVIFHGIQHYSNFIERYKGVNLNISLYNSQIKLNEFWLKIKNNKIKGYVLGSGGEPCVKTLAIAKKPLFFCAEGFDLLPYFPEASGYVKEISENVYGVSFHNPEIKYLGGIMDIELKKAFEKKSSEDWQNLKKNYFITQLVVPKDWKINLNVITTNKKYSYYVIN